MTPKKPTSNAYLRYSGLAMQLFVLIAAAAWIGQKTDKALHTTRPYFTIAFILLFTTGFFYKLIKDLNRKDGD